MGGQAGVPEKPKTEIVKVKSGLWWGPLDVRDVRAMRHANEIWKGEWN